MAKIREVLVESNKWWEKKFEIDYRWREIHKEISGFISLQIIAITGLRRVGKTTLMLKVVKDYTPLLFNILQ